MTFSYALDVIKGGGWGKRVGWNGAGMYVFLIGEVYDSGLGHWTYTNGENDNLPLRPMLAMKTANGEVVPWVASQTDLLAADWVSVKSRAIDF
jgi:hypothetical protein